MKNFDCLFGLFVLMAMIGDFSMALAQQAAWPTVEDLPEIKELPDPLKMFDGTPVTTVE